MKKFLVSALAAVAILGATATEPNRVIINTPTGTTSMMTERLTDIRFAAVDGPVVATAKVLAVGNIGDDEALKVSVTMSDACKSFKYTLAPASVVSVYDETAMAAYIDMNSPETLYSGFESAALQGITLEPETNYVFATLAFDEYNTPCQVSKANFSTPAAELVGNPTCTYTVDKTGLFTAQITVTPNADVKGWSCCLFGAGEMEETFNMFAPMMGLSNYGQMIKAWGGTRTTKDVVSYNNLEPNTEYELAIQPWDKNDHFAPIVMAQFKTKAQGGTGKAEVEVALGDYKLAEWYEEMLPSQFVTYTPNEETLRYRFGVYLKSQYDENPQEYLDAVAMENEMNMANWWFFEEMTTDYQINPGTEFVVITAAQNLNYEWTTTPHFFKTPDAVTSGMRASDSKEARTRIKPTTARNNGSVPGQMRLVTK